MKRSVPVMAFFVSVDGSTTKLYGFVDSLTEAFGITFSASQETPEFSSFLTVPFAKDGKFFRELAADLGDNDRERLELKYGDTCVSMVLPNLSRLLVFFTSS